MSLLITCESGGEKIPAWLQPHAGHGVSDAVAADRNASPLNDTGLAIPTGLQQRLAAASDQPARYAASSMAGQLGADLIVNEYSCELIDLTRPPRHRQFFPKLTRDWSREDREKLVELVYRPYRDQIRAAVAGMLSAHGFAIHLSLRSFNLRSQGKIRRTDVGLLYDPSRDDEVDLCVDWLNEMWWRAPMLRVRRNYPHRGTRDGLLPSLRKEFAGQDYVGIEVWLNRAWARREVARRDEAILGMCRSLQAILEDDADVQTSAA